MAKLFDDITVRICDEDRQRLDRLGENMGWLREHLEEIRAFAQPPTISAPPPTHNESLPGWQRFIIQQIEKSANQPGD